jgi:hypothetical protein
MFSPLNKYLSETAAGGGRRAICRRAVACDDDDEGTWALAAEKSGRQNRGVNASDFHHVVE